MPAKPKQLERLPLFTAQRPIEVFRHWRNDGCLLIDPPYQRGDVWGPIRRVNLIRSIIQHIPIPSIIINDRMRAEWKKSIQYAVIDGKQRITTILMFFDDQLSVPGEWFGMDGMVTYSQLDIVDRRRFKNCSIATSEGALKSVREERLIFELVNYGGVPQGQSDN